MLDKFIYLIYVNLFLLKNICYNFFEFFLSMTFCITMSPITRDMKSTVINLCWTPISATVWTTNEICICSTSKICFTELLFLIQIWFKRKYARFVPTSKWSVTKIVGCGLMRLAQIVGYLVGYHSSNKAIKSGYFYHIIK